MTEAELAALRFFLFAAIGLIFYMWPYRRLRVAAYREDLFTIRDELWDYMHKHGEAFDVPAHRALRQAINGFIRLAPSLGWTTPIAAIITAKWSREAANSPLSQMIDEIEDPQLKNCLLLAEWAMLRRTMKFSCLEGITGLVLWPVVWFVKCARLIRRSEYKLREVLLDTFGFRQLESDAQSVGAAKGHVARAFSKDSI